MPAIHLPTTAVGDEARLSTGGSDEADPSTDESLQASAEVERVLLRVPDLRSLAETRPRWWMIVARPLQPKPIVAGALAAALMLLVAFWTDPQAGKQAWRGLCDVGNRIAALLPGTPKVDSRTDEPQTPVEPVVVSSSELPETQTESGTAEQAQPVWLEGDILPVIKEARHEQTGSSIR